MNKLPVIFIAGPTASGKTDLAMRLADRKDVALISVDAAQVYRGMDIGTAKLDAKSLTRYPHALIDIRDPVEVYDAVQFATDARALIDQAHKDGKIPVLVGGTLFYFSVLEKGVSNLPKANESIRNQLNVEAAEIGWDALYARLQQIDPAICCTIKAGDRQRIQRALEIHCLTGEVPSVVMARDKPQPLAMNVLKFNLYTPDRRLLHQRISNRFDQMLDHGLVAEVEQLRKNPGLHPDLPSMRCVGYRQAWQYLEGQFDLKTMCDKAKAATRQLAKRQLTWLRHQRGQIWLSSEFKGNVELILPFLD